MNPLELTPIQLALEVLTAIGTGGAALAAVWAVHSSQKTVRRDRERQMLRDRYLDAVALLAAYEEVRAGEAVGWGASGPGYDVKVQAVAYAQLRARLLASEEGLPAIRAQYLEAPDRDERMEIALKKVGESRIRDEVVAVINDLRQRLSEQRVPQG